MYEKKAPAIKSPDLSMLKEVIIDHRTKIYISLDADIEEAKFRYFNRNANKRLK